MRQRFMISVRYLVVPALSAGLALAPVAQVIARQDSAIPAGEAGSESQSDGLTDSDGEIARLRAVDATAFAAGDYSQAAEASAQVVTLTASQGENTADHGLALNDHALNLHFSGQSDQAEPLLRKALPIYIAQYGDDHAETIKVYNNLGAVLTALGRLGDAESAYRTAFDAGLEALGASHQQTRDAAANLALVLYNLTRINDAIAVQRVLVDGMREALGPDDPQVLVDTTGLGSMLFEAGQFADSHSVLHDSLERHERVLGANDPRTINTLINLGISFEKAGDYDRAEPLAREGLRRAEAVYPPGHEERLFAELGVSNILTSRGDYAGSLAVLDPAYAAIRASGMPVSESEIVLANAIAANYLSLGRFNEGVAVLERAQERVKSGWGSSALFDDLLQASLVAMLITAGRYAEAEPISEAVLRRALEAQGKKNPNAMILASNHALLMMNLGKLGEAASLYEAMLPDQFRVMGADHADTLTSQANLGLVYFNKGRFAEAEAQMLEVLAKAQAKFGAQYPLWLQTASNLALVLTRQQRYDEAAALYERLLESWQANYGEAHPGTLQAMANLGYLAQQQDDLDKAEEQFRNIATLTENALGPNHLQTLTAKSNLGIVLAQLQQFENAESIMTAVLDAPLSVLGASHPVRLATMNNMGLIYRAQNKFSQADALLDQAIAVQLPVLGPNHPDMIETLANQVIVRLNDPALQARAIVPARQLVTAMNGRIASAAGNLAGQAQGARDRDRLGDYYPRAADALWMTQGDRSDRDLRAESFGILQNAIAGGTNEAIAKMAVRQLAERAGQGLGDLAREREALGVQWQENAKKYNEALTNETAGAQEIRQNLRHARDVITDRIGEIEAQLRSDFPQYFALLEPEPLSAESAASLLSDDEAMLLVVPSEFGTHIMAVTNTKLVWHRSDWDRDRIDKAVKRLLWDVGGSVTVSDVEDAQWSAEGEGAYPFDRSSAYALHQQLIAPIAAALAGKRHVFIAAGGSLSSLPFGLLVTEQPEGQDGNPDDLRATKWFADAHALIQIPSLQSLQFLRDFADRDAGVRRDKSKEFLGFGDPVLEGEAETRGSIAVAGLDGKAAQQARRGRPQGLAASRAFVPGTTRAGSGMVDIAALKSMARLPGTAIELEAMRSALSAPESSIYIGAKATEAAVRSADLSNARILALATHGLMAGEVNGMVEPGLVFTPPDTPSEADDGLLTASEVAALQLNADWVILSACNTAAGDGSQGAPGLSGLARAFFYAGARNLLASHWPVRDDVAARLTVRTIEIARDQPELSRAEAFASAMREIRNDPVADSDTDTLAHPNAWAPFTLIGDGAR